ncbi:hypothetical protein CIG75_00375 [Tumebacillus algifaecis]|uniref:Enterotoxin (HBL) n=1 Tax=Tumebacillus algifaecis TaxID=1214604 RepID=A0A223CW70_9BACL|nr:HBL/NHE enterotoxin family protein [Tumebacillus algifaecis]ASS73579.1 hypothetical protein CIG75_00375 [Tumebacillus algifaecis]
MTAATQFEALAPNSSLAQDSIIDYINACNTVSAYSYSFANSSLIALKKPPEWYSDFVAQFGVAKGNAMQWNTSLIPNMIAIPQMIVDSNRIITAKFNNINQDLKDLEKYPNDKDVIDDLKQNLKSIYNRVNGDLDSINGLIQDLQTFAETLKNDYSTLNVGIEQLNSAEEANEAEVKRLQQEIQDLQDEIEKYNQIMTASVIGVGVSIFVTLVGIVVGVATGGIGWAIVPVGIIGVGASTAGIVIASSKIQAAQLQIGKDAADLDAYNEDLVVLNTEIETLSKLITANEAAQEALVDVSKLWQDMADSTKQLLDDLEKAESEVTSDLAQCSQDVQSAQNEWNALEQFCEQLTKIDYRFDPNVQNIV